MGKGSVLENVFVDMLMVRTLDLVSGQVECNLGREKFLESYVAVGIEALQSAFVQNVDEAFLKLENSQSQVMNLNYGGKQTESIFQTGKSLLSFP